MSAIASGVFGVDAKAFEAEDSEFVKVAKMFQVIIMFLPLVPENFSYLPILLQMKMSFTMLMKFIILVAFPKLCELTGFRIMKKSNYFSDLTRYAMQHRREQANNKHNDMLKLFVDLVDNADKAKTANGHAAKIEANNNVEEDEQFEADAKLSGITKEAVIDEETITQSAVLFLAAGFDTTAYTLSIVSYYLATNPEVQEKARQEVDDIAATLEDGKLTYDDVKK